VSTPKSKRVVQKKTPSCIQGNFQVPKWLRERGVRAKIGLLKLFGLPKGVGRSLGQPAKKIQEMRFHGNKQLASILLEKRFSAAYFYAAFLLIVNIACAGHITKWFPTLLCPHAQ
jgi:hypothetical protein